MKTLRSTLRVAAAGIAAAFAAATTAVHADAPGAGLTARYEVEFMQFAIDHHFSALRITELAAGTDLQRNAGISPNEGTSPTPGFAATPAKATLGHIKSLARRNNRMQREEIMALQGFLRDWYSIDYEPRVRADAQVLIDVLEHAQPGAAFDHAFLEVFSRHHYALLEPVNGCMTGTDLHHEDLRKECRQYWHGQVADIDMMRHELKKHFGIADYQPFKGLKPLHGGGGPRGYHGGDEPR